MLICSTYFLKSKLRRHWAESIMTDKLIQMGLLKYGCSLKQDFLSLDRARMKLYKKIIEIQAK